MYKNFRSKLHNFKLIIVEDCIISLQIFDLKHAGLLIDGHTDFAATSFSQTKKRSDIIDFISIYMEEYQQVFIRNPAELYDWEVYMMPFTKRAWWGTLAFIILTPFLLSISTLDSK